MNMDLFCDFQDEFCWIVDFSIAIRIRATYEEVIYDFRHISLHIAYKHVPYVTCF